MKNLVWLVVLASASPAYAVSEETLNLKATLTGACHWEGNGRCYGVLSGTAIVADTLSKLDEGAVYNCMVKYSQVDIGRPLILLHSVRNCR